MTIDIPYLMLNFETASTSVEGSDPYDFIYETKGKIVTIDESDQEMLVGKFRLYYVDLTNAYNQGASIFFMLDSHSQTAEFLELIDDSNGFEFSKSLLGLLNHEVFENNILILNRLEILPHYRGKNIGLIIMRRLIQRFSSGAGIVAIKPFPLQFEIELPDERQWRNELQLSNLHKSEQYATKKLRQYYRRLGFVGMEGTPLMFISTTWRLPTIEELCS